MIILNKSGIRCRLGKDTGGGIHRGAVTQLYLQGVSAAGEDLYS